MTERRQHWDTELEQSRERDPVRLLQQRSPRAQALKDADTIRRALDGPQ